VVLSQLRDLMRMTSGRPNVTVALDDLVTLERLPGLERFASGACGIDGIGYPPRGPPPAMRCRARRDGAVPEPLRYESRLRAVVESVQFGAFLTSATSMY
jgi:hypothetical protein